MVQITVDARIAQQIAESDEPVSIVDPGGRVLGSLQRPLFTPDEVEMALKRLEQPGEWLTSEQIREHLRKLGEQCATP